jgi:phosphoribosylformylglycinamidine synthase
MVQSNTVQGPGSEGGVMRIKTTGTAGHERGLSMALDGNGRWCWLNPKEGAKLAVAEAARKVACTGAVPVAATNCLNFGNPEKPEIMRQLSDAIDGIAEACIALGTPITGGNVSLYNETRGEGIYPTPVIGIVGIIEDVTKAVPAAFQQASDKVLLLGTTANSTQTFGSSQYAKEIFGEVWGAPPALDLKDERILEELLVHLAEEELVTSARDLSDGIAVSLAEAGFVKGVGVDIALPDADGASLAQLLFAEASTQVLVTCTAEAEDRIAELADAAGVAWRELGQTGSDKLKISLGGKILIDAKLSELQQVWSGALEKALHSEVPA